MSVSKNKNDIDKKENLLARLRLTLARNNDRIKEWLPSKKEELGVRYDNNDFLSLPIIPNGGGMGSIEASKNKVADFFVASEPGLTTSKEQNDQTTKKSNRSKSSRPIQALSNRLRNESRKRYQNHSNNNSKDDFDSLNSRLTRKKNEETESSDSEEEVRPENRAVRKFSQGTNPKKFARPF